jgi:TPR repeat/Tetratricopeptide repeat
MSIIHQALKKAQREQLLHASRPLPGMRHAGVLSRPRQRLIIATGFVVALGVGATLHSWLTVPMAPSIAVEASPEVVVPLLIAPPTPAAGVHLVTPSPETGRIIPSSALISTATPPPVHIPAHQSMPQSAPVASASPSLSAPQQPLPSLKTVPEGPVQEDRLQAQTLFNRAIVLQEAGELEHARMLLEQTIQRDPTLKVAYNSLGNLYYQQQQYQQAIAMYERALQLDPHYAKARNNLGSTYLRLAMDGQALTELYKALEADSGYGLAYYNLACVYARAGDSTAAAEYLHQAIGLEPQARVWAQSDDDFARVRTTPIIQQLLGP